MPRPNGRGTRKKPAALPRAFALIVYSLNILFSLLVMERMFSRTALLALPPMTFLASTDLFTRTRERISSSKREEKL